MPDLEGMLEIAREVSDKDWQLRPDTQLVGDITSFALFPVSDPEGVDDVALIVVLEDPEGDGALAPTLSSVPLGGFIQAIEGGK